MMLPPIVCLLHYVGVQGQHLLFHAAEDCDFGLGQVTLLADVVAQVSAEMFDRQYADVFTGPEAWRAIAVDDAGTYAWEDSTYIKQPPFFSVGGAHDQSVEISGAP